MPSYLHPSASLSETSPDIDVSEQTSSDLYTLIGENSSGESPLQSPTSAEETPTLAALMEQLELQPSSPASDLDPSVLDALMPTAPHTQDSDDFVFTGEDTSVSASSQIDLSEQTASSPGLDVGEKATTRPEKERYKRSPRRPGRRPPRLPKRGKPDKGRGSGRKRGGNRRR